MPRKERLARERAQQGTGAAKASVPSHVPALSAADRENPNKIAGAMLREFAARSGIARSSMAAMSDEKIRRELHLIINRRYAEAA